MDVIRHLQDADAGIIDIEPYDQTIFSKVKDRTKLLVRFGVGYDKVDLEAASQNGIAIARTTGANTNSVAEMALTMMLATKRFVCMDDRKVRAGIWEKNVGHELIKATVGILGFGAIGKKLSKLLSGFECRVIVYDPYLSEETARNYGVEMVGLETLFKEADAISIHLPYTEETHHMVGEKLLALMKPTAVICNTARGNIIDEDALYDVLKHKKIAGAGIDVFANEPLPSDSSLRTLDNVILTPHNSSQTEEALWNIYKMAIDIASDFFDGKDSAHILNKDYKEHM